MVPPKLFEWSSHHRIYLTHHYSCLSSSLTTQKKKAASGRTDGFNRFMKTTL
jgi:hypothetical protein